MSIMRVTEVDLIVMRSVTILSKMIERKQLFSLLLIITTSSTSFGDNIPISTAPGNQDAPVVGWSGTSYLVVWRDERGGTYGQLVSEDGTLIDSNFFITEGYPVKRLPWGGTNYLIIYGRGHYPDSIEIWGQLVSEDGELVDSFFILRRPYILGLSTGSDGENFLVVWGDTSNICGQLVSQSGELIDTPFLISSQGVDYGMDIGWCGTSYLIVWNHESDIYGQRVSKYGVPLDTTFIICDAEYEQALPMIAWGGRNYLVVWQDDRHLGYEVYGQLIDSTGTLIGDNLPIHTVLSDDHRFPVVGSDRMGYFLVAWMDIEPIPFDILGRWVSDQGELIGEPFVIPSGPHEGRWTPAIGWGERNGLVVWAEAHETTGWDIYGTLITSPGVEEDNRELVTTSRSLELYQNSPNPFSLKTEISFRLNDPGNVTLSICDITGRKVLEYDLGYKSVGLYKIPISAASLLKKGGAICSGVYFYSLEVEGAKATRKMVVINQ